MMKIGQFVVARIFLIIYIVSPRSQAEWLPSWTPRVPPSCNFSMALWQDEDDYDYDSCCGPEGVEKHGETDETHDFTSESVEKTTHLREELWDWLALGTLEPWRAGHEWKPPTDLVLPGAETGWVLHCFPGKKGDGWVWELLGTHNFLSLQAWWFWIMWEAFSRNTRMFSYIKFIIYAFTKSPTTTSDNSVPKQGTAVKTDAAEIVANSLKDQVTPWCTVRMWQVTGVGTSPKRWCVKE